jgi:hypothetical protein
MNSVVAKFELFIHTVRYGWFGIAVTGFMADECPVIVHESGDLYEDIVGHEEYYHRKSLIKAPQFDEDVFSCRLLEVVNRYA